MKCILFPDSASDTTITVRVAADADGPRWSDFVASQGAGTVFHAWQWRAILCESFSFRSHYLIAERDNTVVGVLPLVEVKTLLFGHTLTSLPFCNWAGPLATEPAAHQALDDKARAIAEALGADHIEYRLFEAPRRSWPTKDLYVLFRKGISPEHDTNMNNIPRKQRAMVRKGIMNGLVSTEESVASFYPLYCNNVHRHGTPPVPRRFFQNIQDSFGQRCQILAVRSADGQLHSAVLSLLHRNEVFSFYAGDTRLARDSAANDFKYWEVMRRGAEAGYSSLNMGRSKQGTGSYDFKKNWGFEPTPLSYQYFLRTGDSMPEHNPLNPRYRTVINIWRQMPAWLVNQVGPLLVRGLG